MVCNRTSSLFNESCLCQDERPFEMECVVVSGSDDQGGSLLILVALDVGSTIAEHLVDTCLVV